ncbi:endoribonuclease Dicer [Caerostris darwini]|uniref:Endoribonuclease Dicer n=1 Tax=Caerostris darwini TaxID=1538125 RepID=A0AAV4TQ10_9ARAC|nr:endoribonuclease Dicer [Caerostris darwini]
MPQESRVILDRQSSEMACSSEPPENKLKEKEENDESASFIPRDYQIEILEIARRQNTIACLGTGTGKTFIAVMLIRESATEVRKPYDEDGKRIFFLVPTVPLVTQQAKTISDHTDLKVKGYYGEMNTDSWNKNQWIEEFQNYEVLVMTAEIFRIIVDHAFIPLKRIQLLIIDECHHAQHEHPYLKALKCFGTLPPEEMPRIFGLSASLLNGKCEPSLLEKRLKELEKSLRSTIATASDISDLYKYGTDPDEYVIMYEKYEIPTTLYKECQGMISEIKLSKFGEKKNSKTTPLVFDAIFYDKPKKCLNALLITLSNLGPWCAYEAADKYLKEIESMPNRFSADTMLSMLGKVCDFLTYFKKECEGLNSHSNEANLDTMPHKLKRLIGILLAAKRSAIFQRENSPSIMEVPFEVDPVKHYESTKQRQERESNLSSIIFVERRITAYVLHRWLLEIKNSVPELDFLEPEFIVGHGCLKSSETSMSEELQQKKLKDFREKRTNVLVATQVLEEGMDIRQCNLVIRFDLPESFRSYVQSKGRARVKNSLYVMLTEEGDRFANFMRDLVSFNTTEKMLQSKCHDRVMPTEEEISEHVADAAMPPYMPRGPNGPRITMSAAISLINRYCTSLPSDMATKLMPQWTITTVDEESIQKEYECTLRMPINSTLKQTIVSPPMRRKKLAKMAAALIACQLLDKIGELNEDLVPKSRLVVNAIEKELGEIEEEDGNGAIPGTNRRRQIYEKHVSIFLKDIKPKPGKHCYLNILNMKLVHPLPKVLNPRGRPLFYPERTARGLALICTMKLPPVNPFTIFTKCGKILVTVTSCDKPLILTNENIDDLEEFHRFIFSDTLWIEGAKKFLPSNAASSYYISPIVGGKIII